MENKVFKLLNSYANCSLVGASIETKKLKELFTKVYSTLGLKRNAKGSDILKYYSANESMKRISGVSTKVYNNIKVVG